MCAYCCRTVLFLKKNYCQEDEAFLVSWCPLFYFLAFFKNTHSHLFTYWEGDWYSFLMWVIVWFPLCMCGLMCVSQCGCVCLSVRICGWAVEESMLAGKRLLQPELSERTSSLLPAFVQSTSYWRAVQLGPGGRLAGKGAMAGYYLHVRGNERGKKGR